MTLKEKLDLIRHLARSQRPLDNGKLLEMLVEALEELERRMAVADATVDTEVTDAHE